MTVYFDYNATAPIREVAKDAVVGALCTTGNPSSVHGPGQAAKACMDAARADLAEQLGCGINDVIFTSGGTESNNWIVTNAVHTWGCLSCLVGATEHPSMLGPIRRSGVPMSILPVLPNGVLDLSAFDEVLATQTAPFFVAIMLANNETGVVHPITQIAERVHAAGGFLHVDAAQAFGKIPMNFAALGADSMTVVSHKLGGPCGIGALVVRSNLSITGTIFGGGQELGRRAGTSNVAGIAGFAAAANEACQQLPDFAKLAELRDRLAALLRVCEPNLVVFGEDAPRLPNTLCCSAPGFAAATQVLAMDLAGFAVSSGSACSSGKVKTSHVLSAMGATDELAECAIRISLGWLSTDDEIDEFANHWGHALARLEQKKSA